MGRKYYDFDLIKQIIHKAYDIEPVAGLIFKLCWGRNFRAKDVRTALASHFTIEDGYPYYYLVGGKTRLKTKTDERYPIPLQIYNEIREHINKNRIGPGDPVFVITKRNPGAYQGHTGIISRNWLIKIWYKASQELGAYSEQKVIVRFCKECPYAMNSRKCNVLGKDKVRNRNNIHITNCKDRGITKLITEIHPRVHECLRAGGAQYKVKFYMDRGDSLSVAKDKVFSQSNWKSRAVFDSYMNDVFEKKEADKEYQRDFLGLEI